MHETLPVLTQISLPRKSTYLLDPRVPTQARQSNVGVSVSPGRPSKCSLSLPLCTIRIYPAS